MDHFAELYEGLAPMKPMNLENGSELFFKTFVDNKNKLNLADDSDDAKAIGRYNYTKPKQKPIPNMGICVNKHRQRVIRYRPLTFLLNSLQGRKSFHTLNNIVVQRKNLLSVNIHALFYIVEDDSAMKPGQTMSHGNAKESRSVFVFLSNRM